VWFSCGAASAVAVKMALERGPAEVVYCDTSRDEHEDNPRFLADVERWLGVTVKIIGGKYSTVHDACEAEQYMSGQNGARCTLELKKKVRFAYQHVEDVHIFGYTSDEVRRIKDFEFNNPELLLEWPLRDAGITKDDCYRIVREAGIELPAMYRLGYEHNNCKGCVKSQSPAYWNSTRRDFPEVFADRAEQSRRIGCRLVKLHGERIFLDELPPDAAEKIVEDLSCGPQCVATP
jgi:hypothetical protein